MAAIDGKRRLNLLLNEEIHRKLKIEAVKKDMTLSEYIEKALVEKFKREGVE